MSDGAARRWGTMWRRSLRSPAAAVVPRSPTVRLARVAAVLVAGLLAAAVLLPPALMYLRLHPVRQPLTDDPGRHGLVYRDVSFASATDGTVIRGWWLPARPSRGRAVVVVPGIDDDRQVGDVTLRLSPALVAGGYDVLTIDLRAEGTSDGDLQTLGAREAGDVRGAVAAARRLGARQVAVLGFSMGGAAAILAAADDPSIDAVVAESAFADLQDVIVHELTANDGLPAPVASYALLLFRVMSGVDPAAVSPVDVIGTIDRPILLIQGDADRTVPVSDSDRLLGAAPAATRWIVLHGTHARAYDADPAGYTARLLSFLELALR